MIRNDFNELQAAAIFVQVLAAGSFTAAARALGKSPSTLTRAVAELERHVGASLLTRTTRRLHLTEAGALYRILEPFYRNGLSLTRIETRPSQSDIWSYVFFIDFEGHQQQPQVKLVLDELHDRVRELKNLGSYPKAVI